MRERAVRKHVMDENLTGTLLQLTETRHPGLPALVDQLRQLLTQNDKRVKDAIKAEDKAHILWERSGAMDTYISTLIVDLLEGDILDDINAARQVVYDAPAFDTQRRDYSSHLHDPFPQQLYDY